VDPGADISQSAGMIGAFLGVSVKAGRKSEVGVIVQGRTSPIHMHHVTLSVGGHRFDAEVGFMPDLSALG